MASSGVLTSYITSPGDLKRTRRELEMLDDFLSQSSLRTGGKAVKLPAISRLLEDIAQDSDINLLKGTDRDRLMKFLALLIKNAPVLHLTLASEPSAQALGKLLVWLRANIHPQVLVSIGVQPAIAAGCVVRTANREFDFSLRESLAAQQALLIKNIRAGEAATQSAGQEPTAKQPALIKMTAKTTKVEVRG